MRYLFLLLLTACGGTLPQVGNYPVEVVIMERPEIVCGYRQAEPVKACADGNKVYLDQILWTEQIAHEFAHVFHTIEDWQ